MESTLYIFIYSLFRVIKLTRSQSLARSFYYTLQLVNKNRKRALSMTYSLFNNFTRESNLNRVWICPKQGMVARLSSLIMAYNTRSRLLIQYSDWAFRDRRRLPVFSTSSVNIRLLSPAFKQGPKIAGVFEFFWPKRGRGFNPSTAPLYPTMGQVPPQVPTGDSIVPLCFCCVTVKPVLSGHPQDPRRLIVTKMPVPIITKCQCYL